MKNTTVAFVFGSLMFGALALGQSRVDQGKPGTQGPWPVTVSGSSTSDGGVNAVAVKYFCNATRQSTTPISTLDAGNVPGDGGLTGRWMIRVCNTSKNSGTPVIACTDDGQAPSMVDSTGLGETIEVGDCLTYYTTATIRCVSNTLATYVTAEECK